MTTTHTDTPNDAAGEDLAAIFNEASAKIDASNGVPGAEAPEPTQEVAAEPAPEPVAAAPAPAATPTAAPTPPAATTTPPVVEKSIDDMTLEEVRAAAKKALHEREAAVGRAAKLQREASRPQPAAAPPATRLPEAERLAVAYPELEAAISAELDERLAKQGTAAQQEIVQTKLDVLTATFGESWADTMQSDGFHNWLSKQPAPEQQKYHSNSVADYATLLRGYEKATAVVPPTTETAEDAEARRIAAGRQQRLEGNAAAPRGRSSVGGNTTGEPDAETDPQALFNHIAKKEDAKRQQPRR